MKCRYAGSRSIRSSSSSTSDTNRYRNCSCVRYHSRSQCVCGTTTSRSVTTASRPVGRVQVADDVRRLEHLDLRVRVEEERHLHLARALDEGLPARTALPHV